MPLQECADWPGIASLSQSVFCAPEPRNTKFIYAVVRDHVLSELSRREPQVRFVQVGANDGLGTDPLRRHVLEHGWRGLLIEPVPDTFARLKANYGAPAGVDFANVAIAPEDGDKTFYVVEGCDALSSFSLETILRHAPKYMELQAAIRGIRVPARRLDTFLPATGHARPHVLVVDTEGYDAVVLDTFDFDAHRPDVLQFEHVHLSAEESAGLRDRLERLGYALMSDRHDALALKVDRFDAALVRFCQDLLVAARAN